MSDPINFIPPEPSEFTKLLNGYEVTSLVAKGGMGAVYRATQISLDREVAIKLLPEELCDPTFREQFKAEARAMAKLNHANLIGIYDYGDADGMPYIVMEFVAGKSLYYSCYQKAIDQTTAVEIVIGICRGLAAAHESGIIHRDIKPANILLDPNAKPKIGDFGLASPADNDGAEDGLIYGTPGYAAPEIFNNEIAIPSDLYAVGIILYELLTGQMPEEPASPPSTLGKCDSRLDAIFKKATRRNPDARYQSANEFADVLEEILPTLGSGGRRAILTSGGQVSKALKPRLSTNSSRPKFATPAEGAATRRVAPVSAAVMTGGGSKRSIVRNLIIIAFLIPAIMFAWDFHGKRQEQLQEERDAAKLEEQANDLERKAKQEAARLEAIENGKVGAAEKARREQVEKERMAKAAIEAAKSPKQRLEEARANLYSGKRDEFPLGTIDRTTHFILFVNEPMTWSEAAEFAERHGGHLATPSTESEVEAIAKRMEEGMSRIWLGGGATGKDDWGWVNGAPWTFRKPSTTLGSCAAMGTSGVIKSRPNAEKNPFIIQWSKDGSNPGSLSEQLARLVPTLGSPNAAWPPSTVFHENRSFLLVSKPISWDEADFIANSADGHLAVISKPLEGIFIRDYLQSSILPRQSVWLGGQLSEASSWTWMTGEPWVKALWAPNSPDGEASDSALRYLNIPDAAGWDDAAPGAGSTQGFLIEWSNDSAAFTPTEKRRGTGGSDLRKLQSMGRLLVNKEVEDYEKSLSVNRENFISSVNHWFSLQTKNKKTDYEDAYDALVDQVEEEIDLSRKISLGNLPAEVQEKLASQIEGQEFKKKAFIDKLTVLQRSYLKKLLVMREAYRKSGLNAQVAAVNTEIQAIGQDGASFWGRFSD